MKAEKKDGASKKIERTVVVTVAETTTVGTVAKI
ncbi:uncharacterized protein G2W53_033229 [Senna tora]|uniref:Uncharacterized protein n=1 Tax=Senna tora TaxID=362788 RepID=A0A834W8A6_9FABA|nr:uncharacterized protein G2W53_033229 [Senna tora]